MRTSPEVFASETIDFLSNTNYILNDTNSNRLTGAEELQRLVNETFDLLLNELKNTLRDTIISALNAHQEEDRTFERKDSFDLLYLELSYFNTRYDYINGHPTLFEIKSKEKVESASVVLDSIQEMIGKLPKWLQKILKVISEILGISKSLMGG